MKVLNGDFGEIDGQTVRDFTIENDNGMAVKCINYGCIITEILVPDKDGQLENIVLGFDSMGEYLEHSPYFGAVVGRVAGRIKNGEFELDGKKYILPKNENPNHIHGGPKGFSHVLWDAEVIEHSDEAGITFSYTSPDGEEGYPGTLETRVTYLLNNRNELTISYYGVSDKKTLVNLTNHSYFNLSGDLKRDISDHVLQVASDQFIKLDGELLPTGDLEGVEGTPFDFRSGRSIREGIHSSHPQNRLVGGYDHPFLLKGRITLTDEESGRQLDIETDQPGVVLYTGNQLGDDFSIRGVQSKKYLGLCLETQGPPDSIHHPEFQSSVLDKGESYQSKTKYCFTVK